MPIAPTVLAGRSEDFVYSISIAGGINIPLTVDQIVPRTIVLSGAITANVVVQFPVVAGDAGARWHIVNTTTGIPFTVTIQATGGGGSVVVARSKATSLYWDGAGFSVLNSDTTLMGAAASGANTDITSLAGLTGGVTGLGAINFDKIQGNLVALALGYLTKTLPSDANYTLTAAEMANSVLDIAGTLTAQRNVVLPLTAGAFYFVRNNGTGQNLQFIGASGIGAVVANNKRAIIISNGTNWDRWSPDNP